jgi:hypothetical protein
MLQGSVTIPATAPGAPAGHDAAMVARYEAGQAAAAAGVTYAPGTTPAAPVTTPVVPPVVAPAAAAPVVPAADNTLAPSGDFVDTLLTSAGLTRDALAKEFLAGGLQADSYAKLAAKGVNKEAVDQYFAGIQAQAQNANSAYESAIIAATVGTPEKYQEIVGWASKSLAPAEVDAYNQAVNSGDQARAAFAVAGLQARHTAANPAEPTLLNQGVPAGGTAGFESWAQVKVEMAKPEYKTDPAFRDKVRARLGVSGNLQ